MKQPHKFHAEPTIVDGIRFASKREAHRYGELLLLAKAGEVGSLEIQPKFIFSLNGAKLFTYIADFAYWTKGGKRVVEDVKGVKTPLYKLKKKIIEAAYRIEITEIR